MCYIGTVPSSLCAVTPLSYLDVASNPRLECYDACLPLSIAHVIVDSLIPCPPALDWAVCALVASTDVSATHPEWACTANATTASDVCSPAWDGIVCDGGVAVGVTLSHVSGSLPSQLGRWTALTALAITDSSVHGTDLRPLHTHHHLTRSLSVGALPSSLSLLTRLETIHMVSTSLSGTPQPLSSFFFLMVVGR